MRFEGMFRPDRKESLTKKNIQGILFDKYHHVAGFAFRRDGKLHDDYILPVEYENRISELNLEPMSPKFLLKNSHEHTRLVGFRSGKRCSSSQIARTLMPIFYSVDEEMCKHVLKPLAKSWHTEPPSSGAGCHMHLLTDHGLDDAVETKLTATVQDIKNDHKTSVFERITHIIIYVTWVEICIIFIIKCHSACLRSNRKSDSRKAKIVRQNSMPTTDDEHPDFRKAKICRQDSMPTDAGDNQT